MYLPHLRVPVPTPFYSSETERPFERCLLCDRRVLDTGEIYLVEKAIRQLPNLGARDTILEYAMCLSCYEALSETYSEASRRNVEAFFSQHMDMLERLQWLDAPGPLDLGRWLDRCAITGDPVQGLTEYQLMGACIGEELLVMHLPCLISSTAMEAVEVCLSQKTRDEIGGFIDDHFGIPPELKSLFRDRTLPIF